MIFLSPAVTFSQELTIISSKVGECSLSIESNEKWKTLRLRAHHPKYSGCQIDKDSMLSVLNAAFSKTESPRLEGSYFSLSLGRLIDYPWLSQYLATTAYRDRGWDSKKGKPGAMDINKYTAQLLSKKFSSEVFGRYPFIKERCIQGKCLMMGRSGSGLKRTEVASGSGK